MANKIQETKDTLVFHKEPPPELKYEGRQIVLPNDPREMPKTAAAEYLLRLAKEEEEVVAFAEQFNAQPLEGAHALMKAMRDTFGWPNAVPTPGFFGSTPPHTVKLQVGVNEKVEVVWGSFKLPNMGDDTIIQTNATLDSKIGYCFVLTAKLRKKYQPLMRALAEKVQWFLDNESIYRGQALEFGMEEQGNIFEGTATVPVINYLDLSRTNPNELIFSSETERLVDTNIFAPIDFTDVCRELGVPLKRTALLSGKYGVGKTLTAHVTAQKCVKNNWTFLLVPQADLLPEALKFATKYQPCLIFCEDIDRTTSGERSVEMDTLLNTVDGVHSKGKELMIVLTTNHIENINPAMLRPGRIDAVIDITPPDAEAVRKLVHLYGRGRVSPSDALFKTGQELEGMIPAVVREVVERAKLYAIRNAAGKPTGYLTDQDIADSAVGLKHHIGLLERPSNKPKHPMYALGEAFAAMMAEVQSKVYHDEQGIPRTPELERIFTLRQNGTAN